jgi:hypothetical protein
MTDCALMSIQTHDHAKVVGYYYCYYQSVHFLLPKEDESYSLVIPQIHVRETGHW